MQLEAHIRVSIRKNGNTGVDLNEYIKHTVKPCPCGEEAHALRTSPTPKSQIEVGARF